MASSDGADPTPSKKLKTLNETPQSVSNEVVAGSSTSTNDFIIETLCHQLHDKDPCAQALALKQIRECVSSNKDLSVQILSNNGIIPFLIELLKTKDLNIQNNAAFILSNVASGNFEQARIIVDGGALPILMKSTNVVMINQAIEVIKTIVDGEGPNEVKALIITQHIHMLALMLEHSNREIQANVICIFRNVMCANFHHIEEIKRSGVVLFLIKFLSVSHMNMLEHVLWSIRGFLAHGAYTCSYCVEQGIMEPLASLTSIVASNILLLVVTTINTLCQNYCPELLPESAMMLFRRLIPVLSNPNNEILVPVLQAMSCFNQQQVNGFSLPQHVFDRLIYLINYRELIVQSTALKTFGDIINWCYSQMPLAMIRNSVMAIIGPLQHQDIAVREKALCFLSKVAENPTGIDCIISTGLVQEIAKFLRPHSFKMQMFAANILKKIAGGSNEQLAAVVQAQCHIPLIQLCTSPCLDVRIAALRTLGYITLHHRDACIDIVNCFAFVWTSEKPLSLMQALGRVFFNLLQDPLPPPKVLWSLLPYLLYFFKHASSPDDISYTLKTLSNVIKAIPDAIKMQIDKEVVANLVSLLKHQDVNVQNAALDVIEVLSGTNEHKEHLITCEILRNATRLLKHSNDTVIMNVLSVLSKFATGNKDVIQALIQENNLISRVTAFLDHKEFAIKREATNFFSKMTVGGNLQQLMGVFNIDFLTLFFKVMNSCDSDTVIPMLQGFQNICIKAERLPELNLKEFQQKVLASDGQNVLTNLYSNGNDEIRVIINRCTNALNIRLLSVSNFSIPNIIR